MKGLARLLTFASLAAAPLAAQEEREETFTSTFGSRRYVVHVPRGASGANRPVVLVLHGCLQDARQIAAGTRMSAAADSLGFIVLYPEQPASVIPTRCWLWFDAAHQGRGAGEPALLAELTRSAAKRYGADTTRIFVVGISAGGAMAVNLLAAYPDLFAAGAAHSAIAYRAATGVLPALAVMKRGAVGDSVRADAVVAAHPAVPPRRLLVIHGDRDTVVAAINGEQLARQWVGAHEKATGRSLESRSYVVDGPGVDRPADVRTFGDGQVNRVELWRLRGLGHAWSGGSAAGSYTDPAGLSATRVIIGFFGLGARPGF